MARARNIKPGFFSNDDLVELPFETRLLFIGLWTIADRSGRLLDRHKKIKMDIFPGDSVDCDACLNQLAASGFIIRYECDGIKAIQISNWDKHQNPHVKEVASTIPAPVQHQTSTIQVSEIPERAGLIPDSLNLIPDSGLLIPDSAPVSVAPAAPKKPRAPAKTLLPDGFCISERVIAWAAQKGYSNLQAHFENFTSACRAKGYSYADWDEGFMGAIRNDWAKLNCAQPRASPGGNSGLSKAGQVTANNAMQWLEEQDAR